MTDIKEVRDSNPRLKARWSDVCKDEKAKRLNKNVEFVAILYSGAIYTLQKLALDD